MNPVKRRPLAFAFARIGAHGRLNASLLVCVLGIFSGPALHAATYLVAPTGNDTAAGSATAPWKTIARAASVANAGDVIEVAAGTYSERINFTRSGTAVAPIIFRARAGETPIIDGTALTPASGWSPLMWLQSVSFVTIQGFELRNYRTTLKSRVPIGILVNGSGAGVQLLDNHVHDLGTTYTGKNGGDAHGIAIYGDSTTPISSLVIRGNHLHDLVLGSSEALVINGNINGFLVESNRVHDCNNIGIDAIGHEGTCSDATQDAARNGIIRLNTVYGINSFGNPAYGNNYSAGGIYVDGGRDLLIERNTIRECDIGIELASEHANTATSGVVMRNNLIYRNRIGGLFMGGYDTARGRTENCRVEHNTFFENDTLQYNNGEIYLQFDVRSTVLKHNVIVTNAQRRVIGNPYTQNTDNVIDYNVVYAPGTPVWQWKNVAYSGWAAWRTGSAQDAHSTFADPLLLNAATGFFNLRAKSPAIDIGDPAFIPAVGELDHAGKPRLRGTRTDAGAFEFELLEFATGLSDAASAADNLPVIADPSTTTDATVGATVARTTLELPSPNEARLSVARRTDWTAQALTFQVETTTALAPAPVTWTNAANATTFATQPSTPADGSEMVTFSFTPPATPQWFARVRVAVVP